VQEISAGFVYEDNNVKVEAMNANHGSWKAFSFKFTTSDRVLVISGDTAPYMGMAENYAGCDLLVHEVYSSTGFLRIPHEWQTYHATFHTSSKELAELALRSDPGRLILYHQLFWGATERDLVIEIERVYPGEVYSGNDLDIYQM
jgi:ribonuclease BN (tRNA processing enzyme)